MTSLTKLLQQMRARLAAATPGPWDYDQCGDVWSKAIVEHDPDIGMDVFRTIGTTPTAPNNPNAEFIAHAPTDLAFALDALEIALGALESICIEGSERYENTADQVPRDHLVALLVVARGKAFWARTKINELAKARGE